MRYITWEKGTNSYSRDYKLKFVGHPEPEWTPARLMDCPAVVAAFGS